MDITLKKALFMTRQWANTESRHRNCPYDQRLGVVNGYAKVYASLRQICTKKKQKVLAFSIYCSIIDVQLVWLYY